MVSLIIFHQKHIVTNLLSKNLTKQPLKNSKSLGIRVYRLLHHLKVDLLQLERVKIICLACIYLYSTLSPRHQYKSCMFPIYYIFDKPVSLCLCHINPEVLLSSNHQLIMWNDQWTHNTFHKNTFTQSFFH